MPPPSAITPPIFKTDYYTKKRKALVFNERFSFFVQELLALNLENFLAAVISASLANTMAKNVCAALGALGHAGKRKLPVV